MGAWGYEPFENDSALDWLSTIEAKVEMAIGRYVRQRGKRRRRSSELSKGARFFTGQNECLVAIALAQSLARMRGGMQLELADLVVSALEKLRLDEAFLMTWDRPPAYVRVLTQYWVQAQIDLGSAKLHRKKIEAMFKGKKRARRRKK